MMSPSPFFPSPISFTLHMFLFQYLLITCFKNEILGLRLPGFPSIFPFITVIQRLLLITCLIHAFLFNLTVFHNNFLVSILLKSSTFFTFLSIELLAFFSNTILQMLLFRLATFSTVQVCSM